MAEDTLDRCPVLEDIRVLAAAPTPPLEQVECTLADGYACALGIEAQRIRLQRELEARAARLSRRGSKVDEVVGLANRIARADEELVELRAALVELTQTARRLRTSWPGT